MARKLMLQMMMRTTSEILSFSMVSINKYTTFQTILSPAHPPYMHSPFTSIASAESLRYIEVRTLEGGRKLATGVTSILMSFCSPTQGEQHP